MCMETRSMGTIGKHFKIYSRCCVACCCQWNEGRRIELSTSHFHHQPESRTSQVYLSWESFKFDWQSNGSRQCPSYSAISKQHLWRSSAWHLFLLIVGIQLLDNSERKMNTSAACMGRPASRHIITFTITRMGFWLKARYVKNTLAGHWHFCGFTHGPTQVALLWCVWFPWFYISVTEAPHWQGSRDSSFGILNPRHILLCYPELF